MAVETSATAQSVARGFAKLVREEPVVRSLWLQVHPDKFVLWLVTDDADHETEHRLYEAAGEIQSRFPEARFQLHILSPRMFTVEPERVVPRDATEVSLRTR